MQIFARTAFIGANIVTSAAVMQHQKEYLARKEKIEQEVAGQQHALANAYRTSGKNFEAKQEDFEAFKTDLQVHQTREERRQVGLNMSGEMVSTLATTVDFTRTPLSQSLGQKRSLARLRSVNASLSGQEWRVVSLSLRNYLDSYAAIGQGGSFVTGVVLYNQQTGNIEKYAFIGPWVDHMLIDQANELIVYLDKNYVATAPVQSFVPNGIYLEKTKNYRTSQPIKWKML